MLAGVRYGGRGWQRRGAVLGLWVREESSGWLGRGLGLAGRRAGLVHGSGGGMEAVVVAEGLGLVSEFLARIPVRKRLGLPVKLSLKTRSVLF